MRRRVRLAIIGDYTPSFEPHPKTDEALEHVAAALDWEIHSEWIATITLERHGLDLLQGYDAFWIAPGSPYGSMQGALLAIRHSRETGIPLFATCGGCQHVIIEFARNVLGIADAQHAEYDPYASKLIITPLSCSLKGMAMDVHVEPKSRIAQVYGATNVKEEYYCNFGLNPDYESALQKGGLETAGRDAEGEARIFWIPSHPFFVATLFVPQIRSVSSRPHPLIVAFVRSAMEYQQAKSRRPTVSAS